MKHQSLISGSPPWTWVQRSALPLLCLLTFGKCIVEKAHNNRTTYDWKTENRVAVEIKLCRVATFVCNVLCCVLWKGYNVHLLTRGVNVQQPESNIGIITNYHHNIIKPLPSSKATSNRILKYNQQRKNTLTKLISWINKSTQNRYAPWGMF